MAWTFTPRALAFALLAVLLCLTLAWHVPMMLWDQLDLVPLYQAWHEHALTPAEVFRPRAGHIHGIAYLVLLPSAYLTHGDPWLDCLISWCLLAAFTLVVLHLVAPVLAAATPWRRACVVLLLVFAVTPGHLANLQWGWQIAVFISLLCTAVTIRALTKQDLTLFDVVQSLVAGLIAFGSFATALALVPAAVAVLALRGNITRALKASAIVAWCVLGVAAIALTAWSDRADMPASAHTGTAVHYALNFLGAAVCRFATSLAPLVALIGVGTCALAWHRAEDRQMALPWLGFAVFGVASAGLIAAARADMYGTDQAFVTRYVSFSSMFWVGTFGLLANMRPLPLSRLRATFAFVATIFVALIALNGAQMMRKAAHVRAEAKLASSQIARSFPAVPQQVLADAYFDSPQEALALIYQLHALGLAPFAAND